ncbi:MAG: Hsp33 family molecular chaperone HslO [Gammaproteobacteria bacterium]
MSDRDSVHAFSFQDFPVRGKLVHLNASWRAVLENKEYPAIIQPLLGEALAASVLLASTLKFDGKLTLQLQSEGAMSLLLAQCTSTFNLRGLSHWREELLTASNDATAMSLLEKGRLALTLEPSGDGQRYQGIVPLEKETLAGCVEDYFAASEQLPTRLWFAANQRQVVGMLLQKMPQEGGRKSNKVDEDGWPRVQMLADTITDHELLELTDVDILNRLFHEENVRLFSSSPVAFRCTCSQERINQMLRGLGQEEVASIIEEQGSITIDCEFCGRNYMLDPIDAEHLFAEEAVDLSKQKH